MSGRHGADRAPRGLPRRLDVVGAGPAGLAAAITAARAGLTTVVHESADGVGSRFHGDFQGLENWTTEVDVLEELAALGIEPGFEHAPFRELVVFGPGGEEYRLRSERPFYYLVRRGGGAGTLDDALRRQASAAGAEVRFGDRVKALAAGGVVAHGPRGADAVAVGWLFETDLADGAFAALGEHLAPRGYAYLLVWRGRATLAVCLFADFHRERLYLERAVKLFQERVGFRMRDARPFGGAGTFGYPATAVRHGRLYAGEAAGFQDPLWGFGMRYGLVSGHLAARAWVEGRPGEYDRLWRRRLGGLIRAGAVNRYLYELFGDAGYRGLARSMARSADPARWLRRRYRPRWWKELLFPVVRGAVFPPPDPAACSQEGCECTWCRCVHGVPRGEREGAPPLVGRHFGGETR